MQRVTVTVRAQDPIVEAGLVVKLRRRPEVRLVPVDPTAGQEEIAEVVAVAVDVLDADALTLLRSVARHGAPRIVLITGSVSETDVVAALEVGVVGLLRRVEVTEQRLVELVVRAAAGEGSIPPDLLGKVLSQVGQLQRQVLAPRGLTLSGMASREVAVLRLVADGYDTAQIAEELSYSERTVKSVMHDITTRLQLRNRAHAVAYAMREGLI